MREALDLARRESDRVFSAIAPDAIYSRPIAERHRLIFYLGHLEAFDWNQICRAGLGLKGFRPDFDKLFEFGIDPEIGREPSDQPGDWPSVAEVAIYNRRVRAALDEQLDHAPAELVHIGIEHRLMHIETLAYLLHRLPYDHKRGPAPQAQASGLLPAQLMIDIPAGLATLGAPRDGRFGWDNEFSENRVEVPAFRISRFKVTNGDYLKYVEQGGESSPFWLHQNGEWRLRCMFGDIPLPLDWPVYVTQLQTQAYAQSLGLALPTEAQYHRAAFGTPEGVEREYPWGSTTPDQVPGNFGLRHWDPVAVQSTPETDSAFGVSQLVGNGWEWTSTIFAPFEGFEPFPTYPGYSANFFDNQHYVMKGGSPRTASALLRRSFRNWFRPDYPHVYAGFRLVENF